VANVFSGGARTPEDGAAGASVKSDLRPANRSKCPLSARLAGVVGTLPDAEFVFVADPQDLPADATAFDVPGQAFSHHDGDSTFEVMVRHYDIRDPGVARIGQIVHEADIEDERYDAPEAPGLDAIIRGMGKLFGDDQRLIDAGMPVYDGLLAMYRDGGLIRASSTARDV
jgi:hypothetical protein